MMRGVSAEGLHESIDRLEQVAESGDALTLGAELLSVADLLSREGSLRRAMTDPSAATRARSELVHAIFDDKLSADTVDVVAAAAAARWSSTTDFVNAVEQLGVLAYVIEAERNDALDDLEDELFRFERIVSSDPDLRDAITNKQIPATNRETLVSGLLEGKASVPAARLAVQAVSSTHRSFETALEEFQKVASERRRRLIALVRSAVELTDEQRERLSAALARQYGRSVHLNTVVDPDVLGGIRVELGDDVIDGSIAGRLDDARRRMTG
jgi:F-type H+-transporting ATPase subunit delta